MLWMLKSLRVNVVSNFCSELFNIFDDSKLQMIKPILEITNTAKLSSSFLDNYKQWYEKWYPTIFTEIWKRVHTCSYLHNNTMCHYDIISIVQLYSIIISNTIWPLSGHRNIKFNYPFYFSYTCILFLFIMKWMTRSGVKTGQTERQNIFGSTKGHFRCP